MEWHQENFPAFWLADFRKKPRHNSISHSLISFSLVYTRSQQHARRIKLSIRSAFWSADGRITHQKAGTQRNCVSVESIYARERGASSTLQGIFCNINRNYANFFCSQFLEVSCQNVSLCLELATEGGDWFQVSSLRNWNGMLCAQQNARAMVPEKMRKCQCKTCINARCLFWN